MQKAQYAARRFSDLPGVRIALQGPFFKEFLVNFDHSGKTVSEINRELLQHKIFGGKDVSGEFPELGQSALYCVTEIITEEDIERLVFALKKIIT